MAQLGIKNVSKKLFAGTFDGVIHEFKAGELKLLDPVVAMHLSGASNQAAIGGYALKIIPLEDIPEELRKEPETKIDSLMGLKAIDKSVEIMFDGRIWKFPKGDVVFAHKEVASQLIARSIEDGKPTLAEAKPEVKEVKVEAPKKEEVKNKNEKKEGK